MGAEYMVSFAIAAASSLVLTLLVRTAARRWNLVAKPRADRWHRRPTALFGGVAIFGAFAAAYLLRRPVGVAGGTLLVVCSSGMFLLGLVDDFVQLKPYAKLVGQIIVSAVYTTFGLRLHWLPAPIADQVLTIFWLVGITNALNLLDNLDGLAGGVAASASGFLV
jgi:UDP-GlcNAc:undecaprenyl-phosphate GlcNAc-1-phosphate transferase